MQAFEIMYELRKQGLTQADLAAELNVRGGIISNVIHGRTTSYRVASCVAAKIGRPIHDIWPERYVFRPRRAPDPSRAGGGRM